MTKTFRRALTCSIIFIAVAASLGDALQKTNLVPDASFESPAPLWIGETSLGAGQNMAFAAKELVTGAADGKYVLAIQGWEKAGTKILSPAFALDSETYSATLKARSSGRVEGATVELALYDEKGAQRLASFGTAPLDGKGQWSALVGTAVKLAAPAASGRLAIVVSGPQKGARVEIDQLGLFAGSVVGDVNSVHDFIWFEAEEMAGGKAWKVAEHYTGWYSDQPSGMKMLAGPDGIAEADNKPVSKTVTVGVAGPHRLWMRFLSPHSEYSGKFTIALQQNGETLAFKEITDNDPAHGPQYSWVWTSLDANLKTGAAQIVVTRPAAGTSWVNRKLDLFLLTSLLDHKPKLDDFRPRVYMRFTNLSTAQEPFNLWMFVRRHQPPVYYAVPGMLSAAGLSGSYYAPEDKEKWLALGESSPWVKVSDSLLPGGGRNNVQLIATRKMHTTGYVTGPIKGKLEFALGDEHRPLRTIEVDQNAPRILLTLPYDFEKNGDQIYTPFDYIEKTEAVLDKIGKPKGKVAKHLDLNVILQFESGIDDQKVIEREINIIKRLGFNGTFLPVAPAEQLVKFHAAHGLQQHFGLYVDIFDHTKGGCQNAPNLEKLDALFKEQAKTYAPIMNKIERMKLSDEPGAMSYEHIVSHDVCKLKFAADLKAQGLTPQQLGVASWDEVVPVLPKDKEKRPQLFYYSGLFRLKSFADFLKAGVAAKKKHLPPSVKTYVNYSPPLADHLSWDHRGTDLFLSHRNGALEMLWTEDWLGYGASPQQMAPLYAQLRAAGAPTNEVLGGYMIGVDGATAILQRLKYYELIAAGARHVNVYNYGPLYAGIDSWSTTHAIYPTLSAVQHEFGVIDEALKGTTRRKTDIAILYNRTAGIWAHNTSTTEQDARIIHWALAHAGYDADFVSEEDIETGKLANYKVLYLNGIQIRREAMSKIGNWAWRGGTLFGSAGAGTRDEYNRPLELGEKIFGAQSQNLKLENDSGRPKYELRVLPVLDVLSSVAGSGAPEVSFNQLSFREILTPAAEVKVILKNKAGETAGVLHKFGKGTAIRVAAAPGITYLNDAVKEKDYDIDSYLPKKYRTELRDFIAWPAKLAGAARIAEANAPITEITRYDAKDRAVVFVINHQAAPMQNFIMKLPQAGHFTKAYTASGKPVQLKSLAGGVLQVSLPLDVTDAVVLTAPRRRTNIKQASPTIPVARDCACSLSRERPVKCHALDKSPA